LAEKQNNIFSNFFLKKEQKYVFSNFFDKDTKSPKYEDKPQYTPCLTYLIYKEMNTEYENINIKNEFEVDFKDMKKNEFKECKYNPLFMVPKGYTHVTKPDDKQHCMDLSYSYCYCYNDTNNTLPHIKYWINLICEAANCKGLSYPDPGIAQRKMDACSSKYLKHPELYIIIDLQSSTNV